MNEGLFFYQIKDYSDNFECIWKLVLLNWFWVKHLK